MFSHIPPLRAKDNTRPSVVVDSPPTQQQSDSHLATLLATSLSNTPDLALCLQLSRDTPTKVTLTNLRTNEVMYTIRDTGRGTFSKKPDHEVWRGSDDSGLFVGSVRIGKTGVEVKLPVEGRDVKGVEEWEVGDGRIGKWETVALFKGGGRSSADQAIAILECRDQTIGLSGGGGDGDNERRICTVKLVDVFPNGCFVVWDPKANVDAGGDWRLLDEIVTVSYANMEKARRKCLTGPTDLGTAGGMPGFMFTGTMSV